MGHDVFTRYHTSAEACYRTFYTDKKRTKCHHDTYHLKWQWFNKEEKNQFTLKIVTLKDRPRHIFSVGFVSNSLRAYFLFKQSSMRDTVHYQITCFPTCHPSTHYCHNINEGVMQIDGREIN